MAVKVTYGSTGVVRQELETARLRDEAAKRDGARRAGPAPASALAVPLSDAVVTSFKTTSRAAEPPPTIRNHREAESLADDVAERIRDEGEGAFSAHRGLGGSATGKHLLA